MNICYVMEIIEPEIAPTKQYKGEFKSSRSPEIKNQVGAGFFSRVTNSKKDPHTVKKYTRNFSTLGKKDGFRTYADYIYHNKLWENPYFPRIYKKDTIEDKHGKRLYKYEIEKLMPIQQLSIKEFLAIFENVLGITSPKTLKEKLKNHMEVSGYSESNKQHIKLAMTDIIAHILLRSIITGNTDQIKDSNLKNAIHHLHILEIHERLSLDMHNKNIMARRTPYGAQLVITDPFS